MIPVDLNDTKVKLFSKVDAFIAEFAGDAGPSKCCIQRC